MPSSHVVVSRATAALHRSALARHVPLGLILVLASVLRLLYLDAPFPEPVLAELMAHEQIASAKPLTFDVEAV